MTKRSVWSRDRNERHIPGDGRKVEWCEDGVVLKTSTTKEWILRKGRERWAN